MLPFFDPFLSFLERILNVKFKFEFEIFIIIGKILRFSHI